jgi:hypothetical protein
MPDVPFGCHFRRAVDLSHREPYTEITMYLSVAPSARACRVSHAELMFPSALMQRFDDRRDLATQPTMLRCVRSCRWSVVGGR